jgi:hypothetical protein
MTDAVANDVMCATARRAGGVTRGDRGFRRGDYPVNRVLGATVGWVALPVHPNELDSLLEALQRGADLMMQGSPRTVACTVIDRLTSLRRALSQRAVPKAGPE